MSTPLSWQLVSQSPLVLARLIQREREARQNPDGGVRIVFSEEDRSAAIAAGCSGIIVIELVDSPRSDDRGPTCQFISQNANSRR